MKVKFAKNHIGFIWAALGILFVFALAGCKRKSEVTGPVIPKRIIALSPAAAENLFAVGAGKQVVAVSEFTDYPQQAAELPKVGGFDGKTLSLETILSYKPDFVYLTNGMHNFLIEGLETAGVKYYISVADSIDTVKKEILAVGDFTGHSIEARTVVSEIENKLAKIAADGGVGAESEKTLAYYEVWNAPYMSAGNKSFINDIISAAGYKNIFDDVDDAYPIVSEETIIKNAPEVIFITASSGVSIDSVYERSGWETIPAIVNKNVILVDDNLTSRPAARIVQAVEALLVRE